jgi:hypothetical protein
MEKVNRLGSFVRLASGAFLLGAVIAPALLTAGCSINSSTPQKKTESTGSVSSALDDDPWPAPSAQR